MPKTLTELKSIVGESKNIPDELILNYLADRQGRLTSLWYGYFKGRENEEHMGHLIGFVDDVYYAFPENTPDEVCFAKMWSLNKRGLVGGCRCGCRGDFEITDEGLEVIKKLRTEEYNGY